MYNAYGESVMPPKLSARKPRCFLVLATAPEGHSPSLANEEFNAFVADNALPLVLFHDHFIGLPGGVAVFYVATTEERDALLEDRHLLNWKVQRYPLIFSRNPAAFDEQIAFTLKAYRGANWEELQRQERPSYGDAMQEAQTALELDEKEAGG